MAALIVEAMRDLAAERDEMWERLVEVRRLHMQVVRSLDSVCAECRTPWPCATRRALDS